MVLAGLAVAATVLRAMALALLRAARQIRAAVVAVAEMKTRPAMAVPAL
jgi:hypothetical protein